MVLERPLLFVIVVVVVVVDVVCVECDTYLGFDFFPLGVSQHSGYT